MHRLVRALSATALFKIGKAMKSANAPRSTHPSLACLPQGKADPLDRKAWKTSSVIVSERQKPKEIGADGGFTVGY